MGYTLGEIIHLASPSSGSPSSFSQSPFLARDQDNAERGKGKAEGLPVGDEVYNICICLEMP